MLDELAARLTPDADAYLAYTDGEWPTLAAVRARFPHSRILAMSVFPQDLAEGYDGEPGDITPAQMPGCVKRSLAAGIWRPVVYASASNMPGYLDALGAAGLRRGQVRVLTAHYAGYRHVCGPGTCNYPGVPACDGTQWTDQAPGAGGSRIDESVLLPGFFDGDEQMAPITDADAKTFWVHGINARGTTGAEALQAAADGVAALQKAVAALTAKAGLDVTVVSAAVARQVIAGLLADGTLGDHIAAVLGPAELDQLAARLKA